MKTYPFDLQQALWGYPVVTHIKGHEVKVYDYNPSVIGKLTLEELSDCGLEPAKPLNKAFPYMVVFRGQFGWWSNDQGAPLSYEHPEADLLVMPELPPLTQRDKWLVEGIVIRTLKGGQKSYEVVADVAVARTALEAREKVFDKRSAESFSYILQGTVPLLEMMRTLRKFYDEPLKVTMERFNKREQS